MGYNPIDYDCTIAKMAEQLNIPLWKMMEIGKYFQKRWKIDVDNGTKDIKGGAK